MASVHDTDSALRPSRVVGIGASAGGLDAIERLFDNLPLGTGMAFVLVQHLSPDFRSLMDELLARHTELPIHQVEDGMLVEPDHVYLIPPRKEMIISGGRLLLTDRERQQELTLPIDVFFRSLAQDCGPRAVAIVLSGGGSDGSRGIRAVHDAGGLVLVQSGDSAQFDGMPRTARDAGVADHVLPPEEMPRALLAHLAMPGAVVAEAPAEPGGKGIDAIYLMLEREYGIDFTHYKPSTVTRRIERRVRLARADDLGEYVERLARGREELDALYRDLLIGVTRFFRNGEAFDLLAQRVLPALDERDPRDTPLRAWVAGCATGEEVYSLAILLHELTAAGSGRPVKIFATDVHRASLETAAAAVYDEEAMGNVSRERLERYFIRRGRGYQVVPELRQMVVFAPHNVVKDAPFTRVDLISCRNMLIYLQPPAQQKVLGLFHFALNRGGVMFLGPSESPGQLANDFEVVNQHWKIYRKYSDVRVPVNANTRFHAAPAPERRSIGEPQGPLAQYSVSQLLGTYDALLEEFMPPSLLVNHRGEVVHAFAGASRYLKLRDGRQGLDVLDVVEGDLRLVLVGGLQRALKEPSPVVFNGVRVGPDDCMHRITIRRIRGRGAGAPHCLVSFQSAEGTIAVPASRETQFDLDTAQRAEVGALEAELTHTKENLHAAIEELQASNEELQASNEELVASNEELQSTNEELQSVNEELYTVNAEYQRKITELTELTNDMDNLLSSTEIGTIFLDRELRIRKFTPQIAESFSLLPQDVGRPIESFAHGIDHPELPADLKNVLTTGERMEREVRDRRGGAFFLRVLPYRAHGEFDGVVITLIDVSGLKAAEDALFHERYLLHSLLSSVADAIYFKDARGKFIRVNRAMAARLGVESAEAVAGKTAFELDHQALALALHRQDEVVVRTGASQHDSLEPRADASGSDGWDVVTRLPLVDQSNKVVGVVGVLRDVTREKRAEQKIQEAVRRRDEFLAMLSHELRNPLNAIVAATALFKSRSQEHELVQVIDRQSKQMARLLDDLLEASRVTQDKIELRMCVADVHDVVTEAADAVRSSMESRGLEFKVRRAPGPILVECDTARLQQVVVNLLHNAAKYSQRGGHVLVAVERIGAEAVLRVEDDGVGIPKGMLDAVFELFVQSNRTLDRAQGGIGVGLTLVRSLVTMHGGTVTAESEGEGKGSRFTVRLPVTSRAVSEKPRERPAPPQRFAPGAKVVVVEDNEDGREILCQMLRLAGFDCHAAADGKAGLDLITSLRPEVAIVDLGLPEIDGLELARRVRREPSVANTFLIALTGYGQRSDRLGVRRAGFDEHLVKPTNPDEVVALLRGDDDGAAPVRTLPPPPS